METAHLLFSSQQLLASFHRWISWKLGELDNFLSVLASGVAWCRNDLPAFHRSFLVRGLVWNITFWFPFQGAGVWEHGLGTSVHPWCPGRGVSTWAIIRHSVFWGFPSEYIYSIQGWIDQKQQEKFDAHFTQLFSFYIAGSLFISQHPAWQIWHTRKSFTFLATFYC